MVRKKSSIYKRCVLANTSTIPAVCRGFAKNCAPQEVPLVYNAGDRTFYDAIVFKLMIQIISAFDIAP